MSKIKTHKSVEEKHSEHSKHTNKDTKTKKTRKPKRLRRSVRWSIKFVLIFALLFAFFYVNQSFSNSIALLAVNEDENGESGDGSIIDLELEVKPGSGKIFVNLNTIEEIDTQISIINSQKIACDLFELNCNEYDFYYTFKGSALVLKGPSASSAITILTAKTLNKEKLNNKAVITGSLNSGGIIGNVGGIDAKIKVAEEQGFDTVIIPLFSTYNSSIEREIEVIKTVDIIDAYNQFNGMNYELKHHEIDSSEYKVLMKDLSDMLCNRSMDLKDMINFDNIEENSTADVYYKAHIDTFNNSVNAMMNENYYSRGSFCYNSNLNLRRIIEEQANHSEDEIDAKIRELKIELLGKKREINNKDYKSNIETLNDFYVYLILTDRLEEAVEVLGEVKDIEELRVNMTEVYERIENMSIENNTTINSSYEEELINASLALSESREGQIIQGKNNLYSTALERSYTVYLWEELITHSGSKITFSDSTISEACLKINQQINIKGELLRNYGFSFFNEEIEKQTQLSSPFGNKYLCIYTGLELDGRMNTVLNSFGIENDDNLNYTNDILNAVESRITNNDYDDFPIIPYIYLEYANDLYRQGDFTSSMLYSNYAISYADLNLYLEKEEVAESYFNENMNELFNFSSLSLIFIGAILFLIAFI